MTADGWWWKKPLELPLDLVADGSFETFLFYFYFHNVILRLVFLCCFAMAQRNRDSCERCNLEMDSILAKLGVSAENTREDLAKYLAQKPPVVLKPDLFVVARANNLAHSDDLLVQRQKRGTGQRLESKLANDIA